MVLCKKIFAEQHWNIIAASVSNWKRNTWIRCSVYFYIQVDNWPFFNVAAANVDINGFIAWKLDLFAANCFKRNRTLLQIDVGSMQNAVTIIASISFCFDGSNALYFNGQVYTNHNSFLIEFVKVIHNIIYKYMDDIIS